MAAMSISETADDGDVVVGLGARWFRLCGEPPVSHGDFWKNFLFYVAASSRSHLEIWTLPSPLYLSVLLVYGCCLWSTSYWFFGTRALLGSTVETSSTGGFGRISVFSTLQ